MRQSLINRSMITRAILRREKNKTFGQIHLSRLTDCAFGTIFMKTVSMGTTRMAFQNTRAEIVARRFILCLSVLTISLQLFAQPGDAGKTEKFRQNIRHIIVIYEENWSFDGLYGKFPGCDNLQQAGEIRQTGKNGETLKVLPRPLIVPPAYPVKRSVIPEGLAVAPYNLLAYTRLYEKTGDLVHKFYTEQLQIDGGKMDRFVCWSDNGGLVMSYYDISNMPEGKLARQFTLCDHFFHSAFGGSFLNHIWLVAAATPQWSNAPRCLISQPDTAKPGFDDNQLTPDGYVVNTTYSRNHPHPPNIADSLLMPGLTLPTIGDRLNDKGISWAWYSGGWKKAIKGKPDASFQYNHQPFSYFSNFGDGSSLKNEHLKDEQQFLKALKGKDLPSVSFIKPLGRFNEHPGYATVQAGQKHLSKLVKKIMRSRYWKDCVIIITYDENGGRWDNVAPPVIDRWGPGTRVPAVIVSPFAKKEFVDHTSYETVSILKFIETRYGLEPLSTRDARANDLLNAFDF